MTFPWSGKETCRGPGHCLPAHGELLTTPQSATRRARDNIVAIGMPVMWRDLRGSLQVVDHRVAHEHAPYCNNLERY